MKRQHVLFGAVGVILVIAALFRTGTIPNTTTPKQMKINNQAVAGLAPKSVKIAPDATTSGACAVVHFQDPSSNQYVPYVVDFCYTMKRGPGSWLSYRATCNSTTKIYEEFPSSGNPAHCGGTPSGGGYAFPLDPKLGDVCGTANPKCSVPVSKYMAPKCTALSVVGGTSSLPGQCEMANKFYCDSNGYTVQTKYADVNCVGTSPLWSKWKQNECAEHPGEFIKFQTPCIAGNITAPSRPSTPAGSGTWASQMAYSQSGCKGTVLLDKVIQLDQCFVPGKKLFCTPKSNTNTRDVVIVDYAYSADPCAGPITQLTIFDADRCMQGGTGGSQTPFSIFKCSTDAALGNKVPTYANAFAGRKTFTANVYLDGQCKTQVGTAYKSVDVCSSGDTEFFTCGPNGATGKRWSTPSDRCHLFQPHTSTVFDKASCVFWDGVWLKFASCDVVPPKSGAASVWHTVSVAFVWLICVFLWVS